jgi:hypothetical protein
VRLRVSKRLGPARIAFRLGLAPSTVHAVLARYGCPPLAHLDRGTGAPVRRYERSQPGELVHVDVKKLGNIPDGGGWRTAGRTQGKLNRAGTPATGRNRYGQPLLGYGYLHTALDDHSRLAYTEILPDEKKETAAGFLARAHDWYAAAGITIERILSDNGACYRSRDWLRRAPDSASRTNAPAPTGPRPTGKSSAITAPSPTNGPTPSPTPQKPNTVPPLTPGSTPTTITGDTPRSRASHPPAASPTCQGRTGGLTPEGSASSS